MDQFTRRALGELIEAEDDCCVSIFMPKHRTGQESRQDPIRLRNLLRRAEELLVERGLRSRETRQILEPARELSDDRLAWESRDLGLVLYLSRSGIRGYHVPEPLAERVQVGRRFCVLPLVPLVAENEQFSILAVSAKHVRFLEATRLSVERREIPGMPSSVEEVLSTVEGQREIHFHSVAPASREQKGSIIHGAGTSVEMEERKQRLLEYCQRINRAVSDFLNERRTPLVLACDTTMLGNYREVNSYAYIKEESIAGNPDGRRDEELRDEAWRIIDKEVKAREREAVNRYGLAHGQQKALSRIEDIVLAAYDGRVTDLLVQRGVQQWGRFDPESRTVERSGNPSSEYEDLFNVAAVYTLLRDGDVHCAAREEMPGEMAIGAVLRY